MIDDKQSNYSVTGYLALDVGTHAVKVALVLIDGTIGPVVRRPIQLSRIDDQRVEQDPNDILEALQEAIREVLEAGTEITILGTGLAIQRSTVLAWSTATGISLSKALSWQDTRGHEQVSRIAALGTVRQQIEQRSGLVVSPHYGASKIHWLQQRHKTKNTCISPLVSFLVFHLLECKGIVCDEANAGRTQLWNIQKRQWDSSLCSYFSVESNYLPVVQPSISNYGLMKEQSFPLLAVAGDQNAALLGALSLEKAASDTVLVNLGSGAFILGPQPLDAKQPKGLLRSIVYSDSKQGPMILEATVNGAGLALTWFAKQPEVQSLGGEPWLLEQLHRWLTVNNNFNTLFYNSIGGIGSPYWRAGVTSFFKPDSVSIESKSVAIIESIVFLLLVNIQLIQEANPSIRSIMVSGGVSRFDGLCQRLANLSQCSVVRVLEREVTLLGVARMASEFEIPIKQNVDKTFEPESDKNLLERFNKHKEMMRVDF